MFQPWKIKWIAGLPMGAEYQTRRLSGLEEINTEPDKWAFTAVFDDDTKFRFDTIDPGRMLIVKPRYHVGETVYIKEAYWYPPLGHNQNPAIVAYRLIVSENCGEEAARKCIWKNPRTMPAWAARYFIKILDVQACRTKDISPEDCEAEGIIAASSQRPTIYTWPGGKGWYETPQAAYFALYDSINGKGAHKENWDFRYSFVKVDSPVEGDDREA